MQKRTFLINTTPESIDAPVTLRGLIVINSSDKDCIITTDSGDTFPCPALVISTWSLPPTSRVQAVLSATPTNGKSCNVIVTDDETLNSTSQLATLSISATVLVPTTVLPAAPTDGQQVILVDNTTTPTYSWLMQWSLAAAKWLFLGGTPALSEVHTSEGTGNAAYIGLATAGPSFTIPRAGDYLITLGARMSAPASSTGFMSFDTTVGAVDADAVSGASAAASFAASVDREIKKSLAAATVLLAKYRSTNGVVWTFAERFMKVQPITLT